MRNAMWIAEIEDVDFIVNVHMTLNFDKYVI